MYVFDTSPLSTLFRNYYIERFPSLWKEFDALVDADAVVSTREVMKEIEDGSLDALIQWAHGHQDLFPIPTAVEGAAVAEVYAVPHFQQNIEQQKLLKGGRNADPFVIARARVENRTVVTMERHKPNSAKIPNICDYFGVPWLSLEGFMEQEGWKF